MRILHRTIVGGVLGGLLASPAMADESWATPLHQPASIQQTAFEYDSYYSDAPAEEASESPSDAAAPEQAAADVETLVAGRRECCGPSCGKASRKCGCGLGDPWTLPQPCGLACRGITVGGWLSGGLYTNAWGDANNGPLGFNDVGDGLTANQMWLFLDKEADTGGHGTDWGFRVDYVFGVDGPDTQAFGDEGWDFGWDSARDYGSAIPQLYFELGINDLSVKLGHFYTLIGWEVVPAPDNFFYSHSYTMYYGEPFTHTGALAEWTANDYLTFYGGWTMGWDSGWENLNDGSTFLGGVGVQLTENASLTWALTFGELGAGKNGIVSGAQLAAGDVYMNSIVFEWNISDDLTYVFQNDLGVNDNLGAADNEWYGINQYLQYQLHEQWAVGTRIEWFRDDDGARVGWAGNFYEVALGLNYRPCANLTIRPEMRWDWFDGIAAAGNQPFNEGRDINQFSGGFDAVFTF